MGPLHRLAMLPGKPRTELVHTFFGAASKFEKNIFPRQWFTETRLWEFEGQRFPVSAHADAMLTKIYGDYMTPPPDGEKGCKVHGVIVDPDRSYEHYLQQQAQMKVTEYARSIR